MFAYRLRDYVKRSTNFTLALALVTFIILVWYKVCLSNKAKGPLKIFLLFNSLFVGDFSIIAPRYQNNGKMSIIAAFLLRCTAKFINIILAKALLYQEFPKVRDLTYFALLVLHYAAFSAYHHGLEMAQKDQNTSAKETYLKVMRRNKCRTLIQDTLKGLSKGLNMSSFVLKGLLFSGDNWLYFFFTLSIRGIMSACLKSLVLTYVLRVKSLKLKKVQLNFLYHILPSALLYLSLRLYKHYLEQAGESTLDDADLALMEATDDFDSVDAKLLEANGPSVKQTLRESRLVLIFMIFLVCNRFIRASVRVLKRLMKKGKKNKIKAKEKLLKQQLKAASTTDDDKVKVD